MFIGSACFRGGLLLRSEPTQILRHFYGPAAQAALGSAVPNESSEAGPVSASPSPGAFATTHWSVVLAAGQSSAPGAQEALEKLCRTYWYPVYVYVRRQGQSPHDAQDLTRSFSRACWKRSTCAWRTRTAASSAHSC